MAFPNCSVTCASLPIALNCISICAQNCPDACKSLGFNSSTCSSTCGVSCAVAFTTPNMYTLSFMITSSGSYFVAVLVKNVHVLIPIIDSFDMNVTVSIRSLDLPLH
jgi:hypothetical protein